MMNNLGSPFANFVLGLFVVLFHLRFSGKYTISEIRFYMFISLNTSTRFDSFSIHLDSGLVEL